MDAAPGRCVQVFARDPVPGRTKSRLVPVLGAEGACRCYLCLLDATLERVSASHADVMELWIDTPATTDELPERARRRAMPLFVQQRRGLGERMAHALEDALGRNLRPVLVGSDVMGLSPAHVRDAFAALEAGADAVFAPAEDGGYGLVGVRRALPVLFRDIPWGTDRVMEDTRMRASAAGVEIVELEPLWDVDRPADLQRLAPFEGLEACRPPDPEEGASR